MEPRTASRAWRFAWISETTATRTGAVYAGLSVSGRFLMPSRAVHFDQLSFIASMSSRMKRGDMFTRLTTTPGTSPSSTSSSTALRYSPMPAEAIARIERGLEDGLGVDVTLERPGQAEHGDYATNAALRAAPVKRRPPMEIAEELRTAATSVSGVAEAQVAPPGFLNLWMSPAWYGEALAEILGAGSEYGSGSAAVTERTHVELVSA